MIRRVIMAVALTASATAAAVLPAAPAQARACTIQHYCVTTWYSDASYTTIVGRLFEDCDGSRWMIGSRGGGYVTFSENAC